ncbi:MAG: carboxymuconolactone decarboxylase family protein [Myxococcota bacterium]
MNVPHLPLAAEEGAPEEAAALFARFHQKFGPAPLPRCLVAAGSSPTIFRDAMLNLEKVAGPSGALPQAERLTLGVGVAVALGARSLAAWLDAQAQALGVPDAVRKAAVEVAVACRTYNHFYKSRSLLDAGPLADTQVQLRATPFVQSALEKRLVETLCVAVSVAMGCKSCTTGHVATATQHGATVAQLDEAIRLQAVIAGLASLDG